MILEALAEVDERVAGDAARFALDRSTVSFGLCPWKTSAPNDSRSPRNRGDGNWFEVYVMNADGSGKRKLTELKEGD